MADTTTASGNIHSGVTPALSRQPAVFDYAQNNQFHVRLSNYPLSEWFCTELTIPGISLGQYDRPSSLKSIPTVGDTLTYENLDMTIIVDENLKNYREIHDWMVNIGFPDSHRQFMNVDRRDTTSGMIERRGERPLYDDMIVSVLTSKNNPVCTIRFHEAFPVSLSALTYTHQDTDTTYLTAGISWAYMYYEFRDS